MLKCPFPLLLILALFTGSAGAQSAGKPQHPPPAMVVTAAVTAEELAPPVTLIGTAESSYSAEVAAQVDGAVEDYVARRGELVRKGDVLVKQRTLTVQLLIDEGRASLAGTEARADKARADIASRSFPVEVVVANPQRRILPGMLAAQPGPGPEHQVPAADCEFHAFR